MRNPHSQRQLTFEPLEERRLLAVSFAERDIPSSALYARELIAADIDNDGDIDLLARSSDSGIAWYENTDGMGTFGGRKGIYRRLDELFSALYAADLDGDHDLDVLSADSRYDTISWHENTNGSGRFSGPVIIGTPDTPHTVFSADFDGDGDMDVLTAGALDGIVGWYENTDGNGTFGGQQRIGRLGWPISVTAADVDGDGDEDVLGASTSGQIVWYENLDGKGDFGPHVITLRESGARTLHLVDLDGDGDIDVVSSSGWSSTAVRRIVWFENTDGSGNFGDAQIVEEPEVSVSFMRAADVDGDGDLDLLYGLYTEDQSAIWHENTNGLGAFGPPQVISAKAGFRDVADVDGDGDFDVICARAWYENLSPHAAPGDSNRDFQFDQLDVVQVLQTAKYLTGQPATWQEGDWNDDGVFDQIDIVAALQTGNYLQGPYAAHMPIADWATLPRESVYPVVDALLAHESPLDDLLPEL